MVFIFVFSLFIRSDVAMNILHMPFVSYILHLSWERKLWVSVYVFALLMGSIKDRNGMILTEAKDTKKRWQEYTE